MGDGIAIGDRNSTAKSPEIPGLDSSQQSIVRIDNRLVLDQPPLNSASNPVILSDGKVAGIYSTTIGTRAHAVTSEDIKEFISQPQQSDATFKYDYKNQFQISGLPMCKLSAGMQILLSESVKHPEYRGMFSDSDFLKNLGKYIIGATAAVSAVQIPFDAYYLHTAGSQPLATDAALRLTADTACVTGAAAMLMKNSKGRAIGIGVYAASWGIEAIADLYPSTYTKVSEKWR